MNKKYSLGLNDSENIQQKDLWAEDGELRGLNT